MKYSWEVFSVKPPTDLLRPMEPRWADYEEADSPQEIADRVGTHLLPFQRLCVWDTLGVGRLPVLTLDG